MIVTITPTNQIPSGGTVKITFPSQNYWTGDLATQAFGIQSSMTCSSALSASTACVGNSATKLITVSSLFSVSKSTQFSFQVNSLLTPSSPANTDKLTITTTTGTYNIDTCSVSVTGLLPNILTATVSSTSILQVNKVVPLTFDLIVADTVTSDLNSYSIVFPTGSILTSTVNISSSYGISTATISGTTINFTLTVSYNRAAGTTIEFTLRNYTLPSSIIPISIQVNIINNGTVVQTGSAALTPLPSALSFTVTNTPKTINTNSSYTFVVTISDSISATGMIKINFPTQLTLSAPSNCLVISGNNTQSTGATCQSNGQSLLLQGFATGTITGNSVLTLTVSGIINPGSTAPTPSFTISSYYNSSQSTLVSTGTGGSITSDPSTLNSFNVIISASDYTVEKSSVSYTISFINKNSIPTQGSILLGIPPAIIPSTTITNINSNCLYSVNSTTLLSTPCLALSNTSGIFVNFTSLFNAGGVIANSNITLQISSSLTNPASTKVVSSFSIATYDSQAFLIDSLSTGLSIQMTNPSAFNTLKGSQLSKINSDITTYTFTFNQPSAILPGVFLALVFPLTIIPQPNATCSDGSSNALSCSVSGSSVNVTLPATNSNTDITVKVVGIKNSFSIKPNNPITVTTYDSDGISKYSFDNSKIIITNTINSAYISLNSSFTPLFYGSPITLTISIQPNSYSIGYMLISLASDFVINTLSCTGMVGITTGSCSFSTNVVNLTGTFLVSLNIGLSIKGITSAKAATSQTTTVTTYDTSGFSIDSTNNIIFATYCTLPCMGCTNNPNNCTSCYTDTTITPNIFLDSLNNNCVQSCPNGYFKNFIQFTCDQCDSTCLTCIGSSSNCSSCSSTSSTPYLYNNSNAFSCEAGCPSTHYADNISFTCKLCNSPCATCLNSSACLSCVPNVGYKYWVTNHTCLFSCPLNISIDSGTICSPCDAVCKTCQTTTDNCLSCADDVAFWQGKCVAFCPDGLVI